MMTPQSHASKSRYVKTCPVCGTTFHPSQVPTFARDFACPNCGVELKYATQHKILISVLSFLVAAGLPSMVGLKGVAYVFSALVALPLAWLVIMVIVQQIVPPPAQRHQEKELPLSLLKLD